VRVLCTYPTVSFPVKSSRAARVGGPTWSESEVVCGSSRRRAYIVSRNCSRARARNVLRARPRVGARFRAARHRRDRTKERRDENERE